MKIAVIGSRTFINKDLIFNKLNILHKYKLITNIITGGAKGADEIGMLFGKIHNIPVTVHYPDWNKYGKSADMIKNKDVIKDTKLVIAFLDNNSSGTLYAIELCKYYYKNIIVINTYGNVLRDLGKVYRDINYKYKWSRVVKKGEPYYECSSKGHVEYSALYAKINNKSIEEIYQLDIKGYIGKVQHWSEAKNKPPLNNLTESEIYKKYKLLWIKYFRKHPNLYLNLLREAKNKTITDMFGIRPINQARVLCDLCNNGLIE